ncbi:MAG: hypothetical protein JWN02_1119 [Acidobacteria bacterium]|nr:hypothetical protein [Acidobacteriota bacterium]
MERKTIVKFSHPYVKHGYQDIGGRGQSPGNASLWGDYRIEFNTDLDECDYWFVYESVPRTEQVRVPEGHIILLPSEVELVRTYEPSYLRQFDWIVTSRGDLPGHKVIRAHYITAWFVKRTYDQLKNDPAHKSGIISVLASDKTNLKGHRKRFAFINRLIGHFKDRLDVFGRIGGNFCDDKWDALAPYKYSVVIENGELPDYWSEKIADCYLAQTMPLYAGCPNIGDYFPERSFVAIDLDDYKSSIRAIEEAIETSAYERNLDDLIVAKNKVLDEYQFFPYVVKVLQSNPALFTPSAEKREVKLVPAVKRMGHNAWGEARSFIT